MTIRLHRQELDSSKVYFRQIKCGQCFRYPHKLDDILIKSDKPNLAVKLTNNPGEIIGIHDEYQVIPVNITATWIE